jgi:NAD(P)H dehydrogenase (quinone)
MKVAVTSASGQLGTTIINELIKSIGKENVIGIARTPENAKHLGVEIRKGDYNSHEDFVTALNGIDVVLILSGNDKPENRIQQHRNIIEAAKKNNVTKIVYTSIIGNPEQTAFSPVIKSNRQTEEDIKASGLDWTIGRNSLYIEPDLEYIDNYVKDGKITNCAGDGKCAYTSRGELAVAYTNMVLENKHNNNTYNLAGETITQRQLAEYLNLVYGTNIFFEALSVEAYLVERKEALGEFLGTIIGGIYEGIKNGSFDVISDFEKATGRKHKPILEIIKAYHQENN